MSDWQPGDLALCIKLGAWRQTYRGGSYTPSMGPRGGEVCTVRRVSMNSSGIPTLYLVGYPEDRPGTGYRSTRFRKIRPHTPDEQDEITIRLLQDVPIRVDV